MQGRISSFLIRLLKPFKWWILAQTSVSLIWAIDVSLRPYLIKIMLDKITDNANLDQLWIPACFYIGMSTIVVVAFRLYDWVLLTFIPRFKKYIALKLMKRMMQHSHHLYQNHFSGALSNKINDVINGIPNLLKIAIEQFLSYFLAISFAVYTVYQASPCFAVALFLWVSCFLIGCFKFAQSASLLAQNAAEMRSSVMGQIVDTISNMLNIRFFKGQQRELLALKKSFNTSITAEQQRDRFFMKIYAYQGGSFVVLQALSLWWLINGLKLHTITAGDFALVLTINISMIDCLWSLSREIREFTESLGNVNQSLFLIQMPFVIQDKPNADLLNVTRGQIEFNQVSFSYPENEPLFNNKSLVIPGGQKVGLVGYSGSGKSTFVNLILRLHDIQAGQILIDNQSIQEVTQMSLRQAIGLISQDPTLFHRSLIDNIRYGAPNASDEDVYAASKSAHADEFIQSLPEGYQTIVGERGVKLSGGQRQRIAIARTILKNAPILILDEATSQLDSLTEHKIQNSFWDLMQGKTTIVIAHRLSTLMKMDRILVFEKGQVVEDGSHESLMQKQGLYASFWNAQLSHHYSANLTKSSVIKEMC